MPCSLTVIRYEEWAHRVVQDKNVLSQKTSSPFYAQPTPFDCKYCSKFVKRVTECVIDKELDVAGGQYEPAFEECGQSNDLDNLFYNQ